MSNWCRRQKARGREWLCRSHISCRTLRVARGACGVVEDGTKTIRWKKPCPADKATCVFAGAAARRDPNIGYVSLPLDIANQVAADRASGYFDRVDADPSVHLCTRDHQALLLPAANTWLHAKHYGSQSPVSLIMSCCLNNGRLTKTGRRAATHSYHE